VTNMRLDDWSPADNPYAIAVSEAQWWLHTVRLAILRIHDGEERWTAVFSSEQIDARQLIFALRQLLTAEQLEQAALTELGIDPAVGEALAQARQQFENALPGIKHMRDALTHFDEWSRGKGRGPQRERVRAGAALRDVARTYSGFGYDPGAGTITLGPYKIDVETAEHAAYELCQAIYAAAHEVDRKTTADLRVKTLEALTGAGIHGGTPGALCQVSSGSDLRIWLSLRSDTAADEDAYEREKLPARVVVALANAGLQLMSSTQPQADDVAERLTKGEALYVRPGI
jgi:hypothetical protein